MVGTLVRLPLPPGVVPPLAATLMLAFLLRETRLIKFPLPQNARLVPQFVTRVPVWGSLQFGIELGTGMRTYSPTGLPHVMVVALFFLGGWQEAVATGTGFAAGRAVMMLTFILARDKQLADHAFQSLLPHLHWALLVGFVPLALALSHLDAASQIRYAVGALLGAAVVGKLRDLRAFWRSLGTLGLSGRLGWVAAAAVLAVEVLAVAVIFSPTPTALVGAMVCGLGTLFTGLQAYFLVGGYPESCGCFGESNGAAAPAVGLARALAVLAGGLVLVVAAGGFQ